MGLYVSFKKNYGKCSIFSVYLGKPGNSRGNISFSKTELHFVLIILRSEKFRPPYVSSRKNVFPPKNSCLIPMQDFFASANSSGKSELQTELRVTNRFQKLETSSKFVYSKVLDPNLVGLKISQLRILIRNQDTHEFLSGPKNPTD